VSDYQIFIYIAIGIYLCLMLYIGVICAKRNNNAHDYYLGGRKMGPIVTAMSAEASDMSSWLLMGLPGLALFSGIAEPAWTAIGLAVGTYLNWLIVARRLRVYSEKIHAITIPDFFARRFHDSSSLLIGISALVIVTFFIPYTAAGFASCGKLFSTLCGLDYVTGMLLGTVVIAGYTILGGFLAASMTDLVQSIIMTLALLIIAGFGIEAAGGWNAVAESASLSGYISLTQSTNIVTHEISDYSALTIASTLAWGLGYFGMPHILLRFMAIRHEDEITLSRRIGSTWVVIAMFCAIFIGVIGYAMTQANALSPYQTNAAAETIIIKISSLLSTYGVIPAFMAGLVLAGILASTMSTASGQLLAAASSVSENMFKGVLGVQMTDRSTMLAARATVLGISIVGTIIAWDPESSIFQIVSFAWAGFGAAFGPVVLFSLFWRRCNRWGALSGMLAGGIMVFVWKYLIKPLGGVWSIYELLPAFIVACVAIVLVSLMTDEPEQRTLDEFDAVTKAR
jgi:sodium/proline symporter